MNSFTQFLLETFKKIDIFSSLILSSNELTSMRCFIMLLQPCNHQAVIIDARNKYKGDQ